MPSARRRPWMTHALACAMALLVLALAGCVSTPRTTAPQVAPMHPVVAQAAALARNDATLSGQARRDNAQAIERLIAGLDNATLASEAARIPEGDAVYNFLGRELARRGLPLPRPYDREGSWRFDAGDRAPADADGYRPPRKLAVLLPLTGALATAATPVRDGLLAGWHGETRARPDVVFYDTAGTPAGAVAAYQKAVTEGADYVLGPLGRDEVTAVFRDVQLTVPLIALNRGAAAPPSGSASFALAPEDDGIASAEYLLSRQLRRVLVIQGNDDGMRRSSAALREQLQSRGGTVVEVVTLGENAADALPALQAAATRDGGVDAVFFALRGAQARALAPTLATAGLAGKPRVATSQITSGTGKPEEDRLLDGIAFPTEAWGVSPVRGLPPAAQTASQLATARGPAAKLFAFGYDAWLLTAYLERLALQPNARIEGATGALRLDGFGNVLRTPAWSTFSNGAVVPLPRGGD